MIDDNCKHLGRVNIILKGNFNSCLNVAIIHSVIFAPPTHV